MESLQNLRIEYQQEIGRIARETRGLGWPGDSDDLVNAVIESRWMANPAAILACTDTTIGFVWPDAEGEPVPLESIGRATMISDIWDLLEATEPLT